MMKDTALEKIQAALRFAATLPIVECLPSYLMRAGKILPGISEATGQIMTTAELNSLPADEAMHCRMRLVMQYATAHQDEASPEIGKTA